MKQVLFFILLVLRGSSATGMKQCVLQRNDIQDQDIESQDACCKREVIAPLYMPELRLVIVTLLFEKSPDKNLFQDLKAWFSIDKKSFKLLTESEALTVEFLKHLYSLSYCTGSLATSHFKELHHFLSKTGITAFENILTTGEKLVKFFNDHATWGQWGVLLEKLTNEEDRSLDYYIKNYYWPDRYEPSSVRYENAHTSAVPTKNIFLVHALELGAPLEVIKALIKLSPRLDCLSISTAPPLVVALKRFFTKTLPSERNECNVSLEAIELGNDQWKLILGRLGEVIAMLVEAGASTDEFYKDGERVFWKSLYCFIGEDEPVVTSYLLEKGFFKKSSG